MFCASANITFKYTSSYILSVADNATCMQSCSSGMCTATFSGQGNCTLRFENQVAYQIAAPQPKQIIDSFSQSVGLACIQLDGSFCFPQYQNASKQLFGTDQAISAAVLESFCTPCTSKIMDYIGLSSESDKGLGFYMDMLCTKIGSKFCYPSFVAMTSSGPAAAARSLDEQEAAMCLDACVPSIFMKYDNYIRQLPPPGAGQQGPDSPYARIIEAFCSSDGSADNQGRGKSCIRAMGWSMFGSTATPPMVANLSASCNVSFDGAGPPAPPAACGAACADAFSSLTAAWGCCLNSFAAAIGPSAGIMPFFEGTQARCRTAPIRPACGVSALASTRRLCVGMPNLNYAYYAAWRGNVSAAVVQAVSLYTGVPPPRIGVVSDGRVEGLGEGGGGGNGTSVCLEVQSYTQEQSASVQLLIDSIGAGGSGRRAIDKTLRSSERRPCSSRCTSLRHAPCCFGQTFAFSVLSLLLPLFSATSPFLCAASIVVTSACRRPEPP